MIRIDSRTVELTEDEEVVLDTAREEWDETKPPGEYVLDLAAQYGVVVSEEFVQYAVGVLYDNSVHGGPAWPIEVTS